MSKKQKPSLIVELVGWYGTAAIILAYALVSFNLISSHSAIYQALNLTGALGILAIAVVKKVHQASVLNIFWALIAAAALIKLIIKS